MFKYSSRFWLYAPTGLFLLLAAAAMIHWWIVAGLILGTALIAGIKEVVAAYVVSFFVIGRLMLGNSPCSTA